MTGYILRRILRGTLTLWLVVTFVFVVLRLSGDPAYSILPPDAPPEAFESFRKSWGLDEPIWNQYVVYFQNILRGNLGRSILDGRDAWTVVRERIPKTLTLMGLGLFLSLSIGVPAGVYAALHRNTWKDRGIMSFAVFGYSLPNFFLGVLLILVFSIKLRILPTSGSDTWRHYIMPVVTISAWSTGVLVRFVRGSMLEVLGSPYVRTAHAKGLSRERVVNTHALPNAAIPTMTIVGFMVGMLIGGGVVTETVFAWPGVGRLLVTSVGNRDLAVVQIIVLLLSVAMVTANTVVDILYAVVDPRIRLYKKKNEA
ncbi:MAG: ABC transporter permease [Alkalispirochaeta sp.]